MLFFVVLAAFLLFQKPQRNTLGTGRGAFLFTGILDVHRHVGTRHRFLQITFTTSTPVINKLFGTKLAPPADPIDHYNRWQVSTCGDPAQSADCGRPIFPLQAKRLENLVEQDQSFPLDGFHPNGPARIGAGILPLPLLCPSVRFTLRGDGQPRLFHPGAEGEIPEQAPPSRTSAWD